MTFNDKLAQHRLIMAELQSSPTALRMEMLTMCAFRIAKPAGAAGLYFMERLVQHLNLKELLNISL